MEDGTLEFAFARAQLVATFLTTELGHCFRAAITAVNSMIQMSCATKSYTLGCLVL